MKLGPGAARASYFLAGLLIAAGVAMGAVWSLLLPVSGVGIYDSVGFGISEGIEARGVLGPWRPATTNDMTGGVAEPGLPAERYLARDGWVDTCLRRVYLTVLRDREGVARDTVTRIDLRWRIGWATFVISSTSLVPIGAGVLGMLWIGRQHHRCA